jgi:hypothetical protein
MIRLIDDSSECNFLDNRCEWPIKSGAAICALMSIRPKHSDTLVNLAAAPGDEALGKRGEGCRASPPLR